MTAYVNFILHVLFAVTCWACLSRQSFRKHEPDTPLILWWQEKLFPHVTQPGNENGIYEVTCSNSGLQCLTTQDRNVLHDTADRLLAVLVYGTDFRAYEAPLPRKKNHLWALLHEESPQNNHMLCHKEALSIFNFSATFKRISDFPLTTQHFPNLNYFQSRKPVPIEEKNKHRKQGLAPVVYLQSHCDVPSDRDRYVAYLMRNISVDSYGGCLHNKDFKDMALMDTSKMDDEQLHTILSKYKFHIAFENAICDDYVTEKFARPFHLGSVPVYLGSPSARDWAPSPNSIIMVNDYESPEQLADYLTHLDQNDEAYLKYLEYKNDNPIQNTLLRETMHNRTWTVDGHGQDNFIGGYECYICEQMHKIRNNVKAGLPVTSRTVPLEHMNCPQPVPSVGTIEDIPPNDLFHNWVNDYWQSLDQAVGLKDMLKDQVSDPESLWNYIEKRYRAGQGAMQHTEL